MTRDLTRGPARSGPLGVYGRILVSALGLIVAGCASVGPTTDTGEQGEPPSEGARAPTEPPAPSRSELMDRLDALVRRGEHGRVVHLADSLYFASREAGETSDAEEVLWREAVSLVQLGDRVTAARRLAELLERYPRSDRRQEAALELAELRVALADDPGAAAVLVEHPDALTAEGLGLLRTATSAMSIAELRSAAEWGRPGGAGRAVVRTELAVALARAGRSEDARRVAREVVAGDAEASDRQRARRVLDGAIEPFEGPFRVGVLLPTSGRLERVGGWIVEGMRLAEEGLLAQPPGSPDAAATSRTDAEGSAPPVFELVVEDAAEGGDLAGSVARLEERGVMAIIGGVRSSELRSLTEGRSGPGLLVVSPTATRMTGRWPDVYTLWDADRRALDGARALGRWLSAEAGIGESAALYPGGEAGARSLLAFRAGLAQGDGWLTASASYPSDTTDFQGSIDLVGSFDPRAVFVMAASSNTVLQLAPQLSYYGMRSTVVAGDPTWAAPAALRRLEPSFTQLRLVASLLDRGVAGSGWERFRSAYERAHRRGLGNNVLPALGHDALLMLQRAAAGLSLPRPRALARRFAAMEGVEGATGRLRPRPSQGTVERKATVRVVRERSLAPVEPEEVREWLEGAERIADAQRRRRRAAALEAVREAVQRAEESGEGGTEGDVGARGEGGHR